MENTVYRIQKLMYIKLPIYLFLYMALGLNDFDAIHYSGPRNGCCLPSVGKGWKRRRKKENGNGEIYE
jgi:hypothetical protein